MHYDNIACMGFINWFKRNNALNAISSAVYEQIEYNADNAIRIKITNYSTNGNILTLERKELPSDWELNPKKILNNASKLFGKPVPSIIVVTNDDGSEFTINKDGREYMATSRTEAIQIILGQRTEPSEKNDRNTADNDDTDIRVKKNDDDSPFTI